MQKKAQGSTEYIVLMGMVLIVALVAVSFLVVEPQFAYSAKKQRAEDYWYGARPFSIKSYAISQDGAILEMQNTEPVSLTATGIQINGVNVNFSEIVPPYNESAIPLCAGGACFLLMSPGQSAIILAEGLGGYPALQKLCSPGGTFQEGRSYEANLSISYQNSGGSAETQAGNVPIVGECARITVAP